MGVDGVDVFRLDPGILDRFGHASLYGGLVRHNEMMGIRGHRPAGQFDLPGEAMGLGEFLRGKDNGSRPFRDHKAAPVGGEGTTGQGRCVIGFPILWVVGAVHGGETRENGFNQGKSTAPQMATSARPVSSSMAPVSMEVSPVAQAVMVEVIGP